MAPQCAYCAPCPNILSSPLYDTIHFDAPTETFCNYTSFHRSRRSTPIFTARPAVITDNHQQRNAFLIYISVLVQFPLLLRQLLLLTQKQCFPMPCPLMGIFIQAKPMEDTSSAVRKLFNYVQPVPTFIMPKTAALFISTFSGC